VLIRKTIRRAVAGAAASMLAMLSLPSQAAPYPDKAIRLILPSAPGGTTDAMGRVVGEYLGKALGQAVVVENIGGAGQTLGAARVAKSAPDGYTLLFINLGISVQPALYDNLPYDPAKDFAPIGLVADIPFVLVGNKNVPAKDLASLRSYIGSSKNPVTIATVGRGSATQLCASALTQAMHLNVTEVPYRGVGPAISDMLGGHVDLLCDLTASSVGYISSGSVSAYAVSSEKRVDSIPTVPTFHEGGVAGLDLMAWHGLFAPAGTPQEVVQKLSQALQAALKDPAFVQRIRDFGGEPVPVALAQPAPLAEKLGAEISRWKQVIPRTAQ